MTNRRRPVNGAVLRGTLVDLLTGENAHATAERELVSGAEAGDSAPRTAPAC